MEIKSKDIQFVSPESLVHYEKNANMHKPEQIERLCKLIEYQGFRVPLVVQSGTNKVIAGNGRLSAAMKLGLKKVPVTYQEFDSEAQLYAFMVSDNAIAKDSWASLDHELILKEKELFADLDIELLGFDDFELPEIKELDEENEDTIPEDVDTRAKLGDVWLLGEHRLMCGDSTDILQVEKLMNGEKADMVFTDPPYGVGYEYNSHKDETDKDKHMKFLTDLIGMATTLSDRFILTPGCYNLDSINIKSNLTHVGCWTKTNAMSPGRVTHFWTWEPILFYGKWKKKRGNDVFNFPVSKQPDTGDHTCPKPIGLWEDIIENFSEQKESILDLFGGSGTTLIACEKTNRKCFMMELDPHYVDVILARWEKYTGKTATRLESNN